jgi:hypothetical protein
MAAALDAGYQLPAAPWTKAPEPLLPERLAGIRADLDAVPAPPWRWIGVRGAGGPKLVTDHSGQQYLLSAVTPTDRNGEELTDPFDGGAVYGDLKFRDQRDGEKYSTMRTGSELGIGRTSYDPDSLVGVDNPVARWIERSAAHAQALLAEVERLTARVAELETAVLAEAMVYRASDGPNPNDRVLGLYATADAAREHCESALRGELPMTICRLTEGENHAKSTGQITDDSSFRWIKGGEDGVVALVALDPVDGEEVETSYLVTALAVASAHDPEADSRA